MTPYFEISASRVASSNTLYYSMYGAYFQLHDYMAWLGEGYVSVLAYRLGQRTGKVMGLARVGMECKDNVYGKSKLELELETQVVYTY
jgi:hypothetical protein